MSGGPADPQLTAAPVSGSAPRGFGTKTSQLSCLPDQVKWCSSLLKVDWRVWLVLGKLWISSAPLLIDLSGERGKVVVRTCLDLPHGVVVQLQAGSSRADSANSGTCCCCRVGGSQATDEHGHSSSCCLLTCSIQDMTMAPVWPRRGEDGERALMWLECLDMSSLVLLLVALLLLLVMVVAGDSTLGKQYFLTEPEDKVATRGERVS